MVKQYKMGFSKEGLIAFLLIMLPNIIWMIYPPSNDILVENSSSIYIFDIIMSISRWILMGMLILVSRIDRTKEKRDKIYDLVCVICLITYYSFWLCYYNKMSNPFMFLGMAIFPCSFFIIFILRYKIFVALVPAITFSVLHIAITFMNFIP